MSKSAAALLALLVLVSLVQFLWTQVATHSDLQLIPVSYRRRVQWLLHNSTHIQLALAASAVASVATLLLA